VTDRAGVAPVDGGEVGYRVLGDGPPIAATHPYVNPRAGYGGGGYAGVPGCATITMWPRGFTRSAPPRDRRDHSLVRVADDLDAVRRYLGYEGWSFWGVSMGGFVGLIYALRYPESLNALILDSTAASYHYTRDEDSVWPRLRATPEQLAWSANPSPETLRPFFTRMWELMGARDPDAMMDDWLRRMEFNADALAEILRHIEDYDVRSRLHEIRVPTLVLAGERDLGVRPRQAHVIASGLPAAILHVFPDVGHGVLNHRPAGVAALVEELMRRRI
jgi:pimeloyl-ACP methyl ester carboxylesterase